VQLACVRLVRDEVSGLHGYGLDQLLRCFWLHDLRDLTHPMHHLDDETNAADGSMGGDMVGGASHHSHEPRHFLVLDDV